MMTALFPTLKGAARPITTYHHIKQALQIYVRFSARLLPPDPIKSQMNTKMNSATPPAPATSHKNQVKILCTVLTEPSALMYAEAFKWVLEDHRYVGADWMTFSLSLIFSHLFQCRQVLPHGP